VTWLAVALGGAAGAVARYGVASWLPRGGFPFATLAVNIVGSALLGFLAAWLPARSAQPVLVAGLTAGLCGGFTTMSTFVFEVVTLTEAGLTGRAATYAIGSVVACIAAAAGGIAAGRGLAG
jgi:CrcB protein